MYGLYIHIPFCIKKCNYCDFISYCNCDELFDSYIDCLLKEAKQYKSITFDTVFIGGGTPTILNEAQLFKLLSGISDILSVKSDAEFSIEANPKTLTPEKLKVLKENGVNRISIGVQSFLDDELAFLGRIHSSDDAVNTIELAKKYFDNVNIDIMLNLPNQTLEIALKTLKQATALSPSHISCYSLILEEGTKLYTDYEKGLFSLPDEEQDRNNFSDVCNFLAECGYNRYEISNFSKPGFECKHNLKYWNCDEYVGLGVAAHSYLDNSRFYNTSDISSYLSGDILDEKIMLSSFDKMSEFMIMGLRKTNGISISDFKNRFNKDVFSEFNINKFLNSGLLIKNSDRLFLSARGLDISNSILCEFV